MKRRTILPLVATPIILVALGGLLLLVLWTGRLGTDRQQLDGALQLARLAPIPTAATAVRSRASGSPFTRSFHLCFTAAPNEIDQFLADSPSLKGAIPSPYHPVVKLGHSPWLDARSAAKLKRYRIPPDESGHGWGEIVIEEQSGVVHVYVVRVARQPRDLQIRTGDHRGRHRRPAVPPHRISWKGRGAGLLGQLVRRLPGHVPA